MSGKIYVDAEARAGYLDGCRAVVELARAAPGCLDFALTADLVEPGRINVYERWESDEELVAFRGCGPSAAQQAEIRGASVHKYRISAVEAP